MNDGQVQKALGLNNEQVKNLRIWHGASETTTVATLVLTAIDDFVGDDRTVELLEAGPKRATAIEAKYAANPTAEVGRHLLGITDATVKRLRDFYEDQTEFDSATASVKTLVRAVVLQCVASGAAR